MESKEVHLEIKALAKYAKNQTQELINRHKAQPHHDDIVKFFRNLFPQLLHKIEEEFLPLLKKKIQHFVDGSVFADAMTLIFECFYLAVNEFEN